MTSKKRSRGSERGVAVQDEFASDRITSLTCVVHQMRTEGRFSASVWDGDRVISRKAIDVRSGSDAQAIAIDVNGNRELGTRTHTELGREGYVLFHCSARGPAVRVSIERLGSDTPVFDSKRLTQGDLFIMTPVLAGRYTLQLGRRALGELTVAPIKHLAQTIAEPPLEIVISDDLMKPRRPRIRAGTSVIFRPLQRVPRLLATRV